MEYGLHNPHANVIIWCPFVPCGYSSWKKKKYSHQYWNRLRLHHRSRICTQSGLVSFALTLLTVGLSEPKPLWEVTQPIASIIFHIPKLPGCFLHFSCSHYIHQEPPNNNLLAEAAVAHRGLNELCHRPSSIIHLSQDATKVFLGGFIPKWDIHPFEKCAAVLLIERAQKYCYKLGALYLVNQEYGMSVSQKCAVK